jgi:protein-L-isoaspartate(D-aspartate) O-methyltransferase
MDNSFEKYLQKRKQMIASQIKRRGITNIKILDALQKVERHLFVPQKLRSDAYKDHPLPIGNGQTISQPYIVAYMTDKLAVQKHHKVLEVGTGSAYQTAILCELAKEVYTIELYEDLAIKAGKILNKLNYNNFILKVDDAYNGWKEYAPFDRIIVTCAPSQIPPKLIEQLSESGKMIIPTGKRYAQELLLIEKEHNKITKRRILNVRFVPMKNKFDKEY